MKKTAYIVTKDIKTPYVINTNLPHKPQVVKYRLFKAGQQISGTLQMEGGKPSYVLVANRLVIPLSAVRELVTKDVVTSNADGAGSKSKEKVEQFVKTGNPKTKYADAALIGAILGIGAVWFSEKRGWIVPPDKKNKLYGAVIGAGLLMYVVYRIRNK